MMILIAAIALVAWIGGKNTFRGSDPDAFLVDIIAVVVVALFLLLGGC